MRAFALTVCLVIAIGPLVSAEQAPEPWLDVPAFEVAPAVLLAAAYAHPFPPDAGAVLLLHESRTTLDAQGSATVHTRRIFRLLTTEGVRDWSDVSLVYSPWYEEAPTVRGRVIAPDGTARQLDPETLVESPYGASVPSVYADRRIVAGPLPAVSVGSVVEIEIEQRETKSRFDAGVSRWEPLQYEFPVRKLRIELHAPSSLPLQYAVRGIEGVEPETSTADDKFRLVLERDAVKAAETSEAYLPFSDLPAPYLSWSTGESWAAVARRYAEIVEERLEGSDVAKMTRKAIKNAGTPAEKITALVMRLHEDVRYTGVHFGAAGIVPATPATTLERKFGDCKDKSTLLVAMLRAAGFEAEIVLVDSGLEPDLDIEMPGLGLFDHAIVRVTEPEVWIDPTVPHAQPGVLLPGVEDRVALVAAKETTATIRTPALTTADNRVRETREIFLAEREGGRIVETSESWGLQETEYRDWYAEAEDDDVRENLESYAENFFVTEIPGQIEYETSDPADLTGEFRIQLTVQESRTAYADQTQAIVSIPTTLLATQLWNQLPPDDDVGSDESAAGRKADFRVRWPYHLEWRYRIHPAPGFVAAPLPPEERIQLGPVTLTVHITKEEDGTVSALLTFDTGKRIWTPEELQQVRDGLERLEQEGAIFLSFEQVGNRHLAAGEFREALIEYRRLAALHPDEALHRSEIALALLTAGLGEAARVEAQRAVDLEPQSDLALRVLGWTHLHDPIGRFLEPGSAPDVAEVAYRKSRAVAPDEVDSRIALAYFLGLDLRGLPGGRAPALDEVIAEYRSIRDDLDDNTYDLSLATALQQAGRFEELLALVPEIPPSLDRNTLWVAAVAATSDSEAALARAWNLERVAAQRQGLIAQAAVMLIGNRLYSEAAALLVAGVPNATTSQELATLLDVLRKAQRHEALNLDEKTPLNFVKKVLIEIVLTRGQSPFLIDRMSTVYDEMPDGAERVSDALGFEARQLQRAIAAFGANGFDAVVDLAFAIADWQTEGDDQSGYRVRMSVLGEDSGYDLFVVLEDGEYRVLATQGEPGVLGAEALRRAEAGRLDEARQLLEWIYEARRLTRSEDPLVVPPFLLFRDSGEVADDDVRFVAAALAAGSAASKRTLPVLEEGRKTADPADQAKFDVALFAEYTRRKQWEEALSVALRLREAFPDSVQAFRNEMWALTRLERWDELSRSANARLEVKKEDRAALQNLSTAATAQDKRDETEAYLLRIVASRKAEAHEYNNLAWNHFELDQVTQQTVEYAEKAARYTQAPTAAALHTLASVYSAVGRNPEARELILEELALTGRDRPGPIEWQVFGQIAEGYGEREAAVLYYNRVLPPDGERDGDCGPCYEIAQRRLKGFGK